MMELVALEEDTPESLLPLYALANPLHVRKPGKGALTKPTMLAP